MAINAWRGSRFEGCLIGLAIGDALGGHFEAQSAEWIQQRYPSVDSLFSNPPQTPWYYTDDTQMAIGVAEELVKNRRIDDESLCQIFGENYVPSRGYGRGARVILDAIQEGQDHRHWATEMFPGGSFGNGAAMRVAPIGLVFRDDKQRLWEEAKLSALPTHTHPLGIEGAQLLALAISICLRRRPPGKQEFLAELRAHATTPEFRNRLEQAVGVDSCDELGQLGNGIAALDSVVTAITCFLLWPDSYEQVVANAILLGGDTDTIAAMAGAISGAYLGCDSIPSRLVESVEDDYKGRSYIVKLARQLADE